MPPVAARPGLGQSSSGDIRGGQCEGGGHYHWETETNFSAREMFGPHSGMTAEVLTQHTVLVEVRLNLQLN